MPGIIVPDDGDDRTKLKELGADEMWSAGLEGEDKEEGIDLEGDEDTVLGPAAVRYTTPFAKLNR